MFNTYPIRKNIPNVRSCVCNVWLVLLLIIPRIPLKSYMLPDGQCVYQGNGSHIVPFMQTVGLSCPLTHNPADFSKKIDF